MESITSLSNPIIKEIIKLKESKHRNQKQEFLVEGFHMVQEAFKHNKVLTILGNKKSLDKLHYLLEKVDRVIEISDDISKKISDTVSSQNIFAICKIEEDFFDYEGNILILDQIQDPGNLGTLIRSSASFNFKSIISSKNTVDFYNQKVLRSTQGAFFKVKLFNDYLIKTINDLKNQGYVIIGTSLKGEFKKLRKMKWDDDTKYAVIIGNEGKGISYELLPLIDTNVNIELSENVDSLNAGVAGSIIMYDINSKIS